MIYLESFRLATESDETDYILDVRKSYKLDMSCHDMNNSYGTYCLGYCYLDGKGVSRDVNYAKKLFHQAANKGNNSAKRILKKLKASMNRGS